MIPYRTFLVLGLAVGLLGAGYIIAPQPGAAALPTAPVPPKAAPVANAATPAAPTAKPQLAGREPCAGSAGDPLPTAPISPRKNLSRPLQPPVGERRRPTRRSLLPSAGPRRTVDCRLRQARRSPPIAARPRPRSNWTATRMCGRWRRVPTAFGGVVRCADVPRLRSVSTLPAAFPPINRRGTMSDDDRSSTSPETPPAAAAIPHRRWLSWLLFWSAPTS